MDKIKPYFKDNILAIALSATMLTIAILGARLQIYQLGIATIIIICFVIGLVAFEKVKPSAYPTIIYTVALALLYQTALYSNGLIGTDIHLEYYFAQLSLEQGWDISIPYLNNSAFGLVVLAPWLSKILHMEVLWVLKIIFPMLFALVPLILYFVFRYWLSEKQALLATFFFIIIPTYFMELAGIARQQIAEVFFAICLYLIVVSKPRLRWKLPLVIVSSLLVVVSHYSLGPIIVFVLAIACIMQWILKTKIRFPAWAFGIATVILFSSSIGYYHLTAGGMPLRYMTAFIPVEVQKIGPFTVGPLYPPFPPKEITSPPGSEKSLWEMDKAETREMSKAEATSAPAELAYFKHHEALMQVAIGMDFTETTTWGKIFRILQYATQALILIGLVALRKRRDYYVLASSAILLLGGCVLVPGISSILNATRFYQICLFMLAPAFIVGSTLIFRNLKIYAICLMVPYFLFTSGLVYEVTNCETVSSINIPYSIPLSNHRIDLGGNHTSNDIAAREWIANNDIEVLYADLHGVMFLQEKLGTREILRLRENWEKTGANWKTSPTYATDMHLPKGAHIFLRERGTIVFWAGIGTRRIFSREQIGFDTFGEVAFKAGNSEVRTVVD